MLNTTEQDLRLRRLFYVVLLMSCFWLLIPQTAFPLTNMCGVAMEPNLPPEEEESEECEECPENCEKSPCTVAKGNYSTSVTDFRIPTRGFSLSVTRRYKTDRGVDGLFGYGWTSNLLSRITYSTFMFSAPSTYMRLAAVVMPDGGVYEFTENANGTFTAPTGSHDTLVKNADGTFDLTLKLSRERYRYNAQGSLISMTDAFGNALALTYDVNSRLTQISDATGSGRFLTLGYDATGHIWNITDHTGRQVQYTISLGKLTTVVDPAGRRTDYSYVSGRFAPLLSQIRDNWGRVITDIQYDPGDRVLSYSEEEETWTYTYGYNGNPFQTAKSDSQFNTWVYTYNTAGQVARTDNPDGSYASANYTPTGAIQLSTDEMGIKTYMTYNANGSTASVTRDYQGTSPVRFDYAYDSNFPENAISVTARNPANGAIDSNWQSSKYDYYGTGSAAPGALFHKYRVRSDGVTLDTLETYTYNSRGQVLTVTNATGAVTTYSYDSVTGDLRTITYPKNSTTGANPVYTYAFDSLGRVISITNPSGKITSFTYDAAGRTKTVTRPKPAAASTLNFITTCSYDNYDAGTGLVFTDETDPNGKTKRQGYDAFGRLVMTKDTSNQTNLFTYSYGLLAATTDANGNATTYIYDSLRRLSVTQFPDYFTETITYFANGLVASRTDRKGQTMSYQYDGHKRMRMQIYPNSSSIAYTYTGQKLTSVADTLAGETQTFSYDASYRLAANTQGLRGTITMTYDAADRMLSYSLSGGGPTTTYSYYDDRSMKNITWSPVAGNFQYTHTSNGQYSSILFPNAQHRDFSYDDHGRLLQVANIHPGTGNLATYSYGYDLNHSNGSFTMLGQRSSMTATVPSQGFSNHQTKFYYDNRYQLTRADYPNATPFNGQVDSWTYDGVGNRLTSTVNGTTQNYSYISNTQRMQSDGVNTYSYDPNGNMISKSGPGGNFNFTYDFDNRLIAISGAATASYTYDYMGRRTSKTAGSTTTFLYYGLNMIAERGSSVADYVFGPSIDEPLAMKRGSSIYYFNTDALGSATIVNTTSGTVSNKYVFDAWGQNRSQTTVVANPFTYTSRESSDAGLLFYRARYYSPSVGRFTSPDPLEGNSVELFIEGRISQPIGFQNYVYARNNPLSFTDPLGWHAECRQQCHEDYNERVSRCARDAVIKVILCNTTIFVCPGNPYLCGGLFLLCQNEAVGRLLLCGRDAGRDRETCLRRCKCTPR